MSDIKDYTPPANSTLTEPIYAISWTCPIVSLNANTNTIYGNRILFRIRKINHSGRVIGYKNGNNLYILGDEQLSGGYVDNGIFGGIKISSQYISTSNPPNYKTIQPGDWSDTDIAYDDEWNVGIRITKDEGFHPPLSLADYTYIEQRNFDNFYSQYFKTGVIGSNLQLTTNPDNSALLRGIDDIVDGDVSTYFHYDSEIGMYPKAINAIFSSLEKAVTFGNSNPLKDIYEYYPDVWRYFNVGTQGMFYLNFSNLIITDSLSDAQKYISDGTIPKNYIYDDPNNIVGGDPGDDNDPNNTSDGSEGSDRRDDIDINTPPDSAISLSNINIYLLTREQLMAFISDMWDFTWAELTTNMMTGIYNNLIDNVQSIRVMPFAPADLGTVEAVDSIKCGWWSHTATVRKLGTGTTGPGMNPRYVGNWQINEVFGGWADYAPYTSIELYLPYYGTINLDTNLFMGHILKVEYVLDVLAGLITYFLSCDDTCVITLSAKCSADVPVSLSSGIDTASDVLKNEARFVSEAGNLRPVGMVTGSTSVATEKCLNSCSESGMFFMPNKCHVRITRPAYTRASNYASRYGYPCYGSYKLSSLKGFTVVENYKSHYTKGIKKEEEDMIKNMMESGVYL